MTSATRPENLMSLAPTVSSTRSRLRSARWRRAPASTSRSWPIWPGTDAGAAPVGGQSLAPCELRRPVSIVAPVQASGMKVTAICGFSTASASAVRI